MNWKEKQKQLMLDYFAKHPEAKRVVIEKGYKLFPHLAPQPALKPWISPDQIPHITNVIRKEEELYFNTLKKGKQILKKLGLEPSPTLLDPPYVLEKYPQLTGKLLCKLHHTYGLDPLAVADLLNVIDLPNKLHDDYQAEYEKHKQTGLAGFKPKEIKVKGLEEKLP